SCQGFSLHIESSLKEIHFNQSSLPIALSSEQSREDTHRVQRSGVMIDNHGTDCGWRFFGSTRTRGQTRHGLKEKILARLVAVRPIRSESRGGGIDQTWDFCLQPIITEA